MSVEVYQDHNNAEATQIRLVQQKETKHFLSIFKGLIIHSGKFVDYKKDDVALYDIRGDDKDLLAVQHINVGHLYLKLNLV